MGYMPSPIADPAAPESGIQRAIDELHTHHLRVTDARRAILSALHQSRGHLSVSEVFSVVRDQREGADLASIYRNLAVLRQCGLVHAISTDRGQMHGLSLGPHQHAQCINCGRVDDVRLPATALETLHRVSGLTLADEEGVMLAGTCAACASRRSPGAQSRDVY